MDPKPGEPIPDQPPGQPPVAPQPMAPSPNGDPCANRELEIKEEALRHQFWQKWTAFGSFVVSGFGFGAVLWSLHGNKLALQNNNLVLRNNVQQSMTKLTVDLDHIFIDHPELRQYFYYGANPHGTTNLERASETAYMMLDVFDLTFAQAGTFKEQWTEPQGWTNWVAEDFAKSPFLREQYELETNWYGQDMYRLEKHVNVLTNVYLAEYRTNRESASISMARMTGQTQ